MKVIGAGLPRTATLSQKVALEMLGFGPCYHMVNVLGNLDLVPRWRDLLNGEGDWSAVFGGFESTVDWPGAFFYEQLMDAYPDAKVLLSVRDGEAWERSMGDTIWGVLYGDIMIRHLSSAWCQVDPKWDSYMGLMRQMWELSGLLTEKEGAGSGSMASAMEAYNDEVKSTVPPERLLVWRASDGWEPLCQFLEVPVPNVPFPHVNDSAQFGERIMDASLAALTSWREGQKQVAQQQ